MRKVFLMASMTLLLSHATFAEKNDFTGVWQVVRETKTLRTLDGKEPPLLPDAKKVYEQRTQALKSGDTKYDPVKQCIPHGVPRLLYEKMPFELFPQGKEVAFMYQWNRLARFVPLNTEHSEPLGPTYLGQSVGKWEDDALVIDTNAFNDVTLLDASGMPHSDQLHVIERYTLDKSHNKLTALITIEDPQTFSASWDTQVQFKRLQNVKITEDVCVERLGLEQYK